MPKAIISNKIYMDVPPNLKEILDSLTYKIEIVRSKHGEFNTIETIRNYKMVTPKIVAIPQGRTELIPKDYEIVDKRTEVPVEFPEPKFELFDEQKVVHDPVDSSCFINAPVGWGKTFTALHIAKKLGQKTLVITHTAILRDQWVMEVEKLYGFKPDIIGSGKFGISTPIVIGNVQTVVKMIPELEKVFGTIIMDEAHHVPASTFTKVVDSMHCKYRIALSGTMERKDGKHILFRDVFGSKIFKPPQNNTTDPVVKLIKTGIHTLPGAPWVKKINHLLYDWDYQEFITGIVQTQIAKGHKVLLIASRTQFLNRVHEMLGDISILIVGETENRHHLFEQLETTNKHCICGSRSIFAEGVSVPALSCVILAEPTSNKILLEQIIGRVMRLHPNKPTPEVLDMQFAGRGDKQQNALRLAFYMEKGWEIKAV